MTSININEAKTHFSEYARRVKAGETIIVCDRNRPFAEIRPLKQEPEPGRRKLGQLKGIVESMDAFFDADAGIAAAFYGEGSPFPSSSSASRAGERKDRGGA